MGQRLYVLVTPERFKRTAKKFLRKHPDLRKRLATVFDTLTRDPFAVSLRTHPLHGELDGLWGVSITYDYRLVVTIRISEREIELLDIGTHDAVY